MKPYLLNSFFNQNIRQYFSNGEQWLAELPSLIDYYAYYWQLEPLAAYDLSFNYVCPARLKDGSLVVMKLGIPRPELCSEAAALAVYAGQGCVRLLDHDCKNGALLIEHVAPGERLLTLQQYDDDAATEVAAALMQQIWQPAPAIHSFPHIRDWLAGLDEIQPAFNGTTGPFPLSMIEQAQQLAQGMLANPHPEVILHGDLHHYNIISAQRSPWLIIDPKGVIGEAEYEIGAFMRNPLNLALDTKQYGNLLARRLTLFAENLNMDRQRLWNWAYVQAVLSAWWDYNPKTVFDSRSLRWVVALEGIR